jgi:phenylpyruvate tautomerase PptA (4-oxalocrotonate tautomerase family)
MVRSSRWSVRQGSAAPIAEAVVALAAETTGLPPGRVRVALDYWAAYPDEIEQQIRDADDAERAAEELWQRERRLLS